MFIKGAKLISIFQKYGVEKKLSNREIIPSLQEA